MAMSHLQKNHEHVDHLAHAHLNAQLQMFKAMILQTSETSGLFKQVMLKKIMLSPSQNPLGCHLLFSIRMPS